MFRSRDFIADAIPDHDLDQTVKKYAECISVALVLQSGRDFNLRGGIEVRETANDIFKVKTHGWFVLCRVGIQHIHPEAWI